MSANVDSKADTKYYHTFDAPAVVNTASVSAGHHGESANGNHTI